MFAGSWLHFVGDQKNQTTDVFEDGDVATCLSQDATTPLLLKTTKDPFTSLTVVVVSNQEYPDRAFLCQQPSEMPPWILLPHFNTGQDAKCDPFCGTPLVQCIYDKQEKRSNGLFWNRMQCDCGGGQCNELALQLVPKQEQTATLSICEIQFQ